MKMVSWLLTLLYPPRCIFCGKPLEPGEEVCSDCRERLPVTDRHSGVQTGRWFHLCLSPFFLEGPVREAMHRYKFSHQEANGVILAAGWPGLPRRISQNPLI